MEEILYRLVYYSRNRVPKVPGALRREIETILASSRKNNAPVGITGALIFNAGCFGQVLEGRPEVLESTFERIQRDPRHGDVSLLSFDPINARTFGHWSMGYVGTRPDDAAAHAGVAAASGFDPSKVTGDQLLETLKAITIEDEAVTA